MDWFTGIVLYLLIWWLVLFAVLPIGTHSEPEPDAASGWRGAPSRSRIGRKMLATTLVAALVWGGCAALIESNWISFRHGWLALHDE
jgi:predicted secreted protein